MRHLQALLMFLSSFIAYALRANLSVAIVAMVRHPSHNGTVLEGSPEPGGEADGAGGAGGAGVSKACARAIRCVQHWPSSPLSSHLKDSLARGIGSLQVFYWNE